MNLNDAEKKVLAFLADRRCEDFGFYSFAPICAETKLERRRVRLACRSLARKGLTKFAFGLTDEDGHPAGSGYSATSEGVGLTATFD